MVTHTDGCHCGRVRFEVIAPARVEVTDCNCSICSKSGYLHLIVPQSRFKLLSGADVLTTYEFNTRTTVRASDGRNWEKTHPSGCGQPLE